MSEQMVGIIEEVQETKTYPKKKGEGNIDIGASGTYLEIQRIA